MLLDLHELIAVALIGCDQIDGTVTVPGVLPVKELCHPLAGFLTIGKGSSRDVRPIDRHYEQHSEYGCHSTPWAVKATRGISAPPTWLIAWMHS